MAQPVLSAGSLRRVVEDVGDLGGKFVIIVEPVVMVNADVGTNLQPNCAVKGQKHFVTPAYYRPHWGFLSLDFQSPENVLQLRGGGHRRSQFVQPFNHRD